MLLVRIQSVFLTPSLKIWSVGLNVSFENVEKFKYLGVTVTNSSDISEEIKRRIDIGNACY